MIVPKNKTYYIGARRFVEGEPLPPHVMIEEMPVLTKKQVSKMESGKDKKSKKPRLIKKPSRGRGFNF